MESAPTINATAFGGSGQITGDFTQAQASSLALVLKYGQIPIALTTQTYTTVSPTLGKKSLQAGLLAGLLGLLLVMGYTIFYYRALGVVVVLGLVSTGALIYAIISHLGATSAGLTLDLSGMTGLIVSVGITVDSYIVYFERLKDEVRAGRSVRSSVDRGFKSAYRTILSADAVSFLGALVLWLLSIGAVRGFAFMLGLSTIVDVITAYTFTRPARDPPRAQPDLHRGPCLRRRERPGRIIGGRSMSATTIALDPGTQHRPNAFLRLYHGQTRFDFVRRRRWWFAASSVVIVAGLISLGVKGLNYSIEFVGGTSWQVPAPGVTVAQAQSALIPLGFGGATITQLGSGSKPEPERRGEAREGLERSRARPRRPRWRASSPRSPTSPRRRCRSRTSGRPGGATSPTRRSKP